MRARMLSVVSVVLLTGCAGVSPAIGSLNEQGYERIAIGTRSQSGQWLENPNYELWVKERREVDRKIHACLVPKKEQYQWTLTLYVGNKETWTRRSPMRIRGTDCVVSDALPDGTVRYGVSFTYWQ